jgi:site-specific recombinase XerD
MEESYEISKRGIEWAIDESKFLSDREVKSLVTATRLRANAGKKRRTGVAVRNWLVIDLALSTGLRVQEITDLKCGDIFVADNKSSLVVRNGKGGKTRVVRFGPEFKRHLYDYLVWKRCNGEPTCPESPLVQSPRTGGHMSKRALQRTFKKCAKLAGLSDRYSIHSARHTYATALLRASGNNLRLVQNALGHSSLAVTEVYLGVTSAEMDRALRRLYKG